MVLRAQEKTPEACTEGERDAVKHFYERALGCVDANVASKDIWIANNTYLKILKNDWYFVMATGLTLLAKYSPIANILENLKNKNTRARLHNKEGKAAVR